MSAERILMKGNEAIAEAAIRAGCTAYFGYPITPQNELIAYMAAHLIPRKRTFIQAESEVAAINMCFGAASAGARVMTSSSSPGVSLKQEGISYASGADLPIVVVNVQRGGPGLGSIAPSQADYFQSTRGGGHGDYFTPVLAPWSVQEAADLTAKAFDLADEFRTPVLVLADGLIGQMMEAVSLPEERPLDSLPSKADWAVGGLGSRPDAAPHRITSLDLVPELLEAKTLARLERLRGVSTRVKPCEELETEDADIVVVAYGTSARVSLGAQRMARKAGIKVGLLRPITLWPFPSAQLAAHAKRGARFLAVEMSHGQMREDVLLATREQAPEVGLVGHSGGVIPTEEEVFAAIKAMAR
jgi:2-oxoglutarate/2-oxoacid ferredoxin oxidoreductase subunit alpha